jgi:hypothetical protein
LNEVVKQFVNADNVIKTYNVFLATSEDFDGTIFVRFIWKDFVVTTHEALTIRERIVGELSAKDQNDEQTEYYRWHDIIDYNCYTDQNGLVLPGCKSYKACELCNRKRSPHECTECWGRGICQSSHVYLPKVHIFDDGRSCNITNLFNADMTYLPEHIAAFSLIDIIATKVPFIRPFGTPFYHMEQKAKSPPSVYPNSLGGYYMGGIKKKVAPTGVDSVVALSIRKAIQKAYPRYHSRVEVKPELINHDAKHRCYTVPVFGLGSNSCNKFPGEHQDSRVYFIIRQNGIEQMCHSRDRINSITGDCECKSKKGAPIAMNSTMKGYLFPSVVRKTAGSSVSASSAYQIACYASDICRQNLAMKKRKLAIYEFIV